MAFGLFSLSAPVLIDALAKATAKATATPIPTLAPTLAPTATLAAGVSPTLTPLATLTPFATVTPDVIGSGSIVVAQHTGLLWVFDQLEYLIMVPLVYLSILFCIGMLVYRIVQIWRAPRSPFTLQVFPSMKKPRIAALGDTFAMPQVRRHQPLFWVFLMIFHVSLVLLVLGHLDLLPQISLVPESSRDMLGGGLVGVGVTVPLFYFLFRRFKTPNREISVLADYLLLILVIFLALFGDLMSWGNSWTTTGFILTKQHFAGYLDSLVRFTFLDPRYWLSGTHYHFAVLHVLLAELFFVVVPFSKIVHAFLALPVNLLRRK